jgi:AFG3 family protein
MCYTRTLKLLRKKEGEVEKLAKELLLKEVLFKSDVESLIGERPFEEKKLIEVAEVENKEEALTQTEEVESTEDSNSQEITSDLPISENGNESKSI